jgi:hypothetical protein
MLEHHLQKQIIATLVSKDSARFSELRPEHTDSNVFTYHLNALVAHGFVSKDSEGNYRLTNSGKLLGVNVSEKAGAMLEQAHSILLLVVRQGNKWLLRRRLVQPMRGKYGFIHGEPRAGQKIAEAATAILEERTGLTASFIVRGSGFISSWENVALESYTHFVLLEAGELSGELCESDEYGENIWLSAPDFTADTMIPSMEALTDQLQSSENLFFVDLKYTI